MDKRTIYSKTGKGSLEISKKSIKLASDERQTLILVDGKSNVGEIEEKLSRVSPVRLRAILERLNELDLVREFVTKQGPDSIMPNLGGPTAMKVEELDELDFTALSPVASADTLKEVEERRLAAQRAEEEAAQARAEESQRRQAEQAQQRQREEAEARERARREEEAAARARADAEARAKADAEARAKADAEARARADAEARVRAEEDASRKAEEEARRRADEEARRRADEEARRKAAEEEARRKAAEEAGRRAAEEKRLREEAEARERERREREDAERRERARREEETKRATAAEEKRQREAAEAAQRERAEAERREREEAQRREAEETERSAADAKREREEADRRERRRREEEAKRAVIVEEKRRREAEEAEEEARRAREAAARANPDEANRRAAEEADRYTAALTPRIEEVTSHPPSMDLDFGSAPATGGVESVDLKPLAGGGPDTFADTGMTGNSIMSAGLDDEEPSKKSIEKDARRELEKEAKENAKASAKAKKDAERDAKRLAKESKVTIRRGGGSGFSLGKFFLIFIVLLIGGGIGYLYFMPIDKLVIESLATVRLGLPVKVGTAKFEPFPPQLKLTDVRIDDIVLPRVTAVPDPGSLAADKKIWNSIDVAGATITLQQAQKLIAAGLREPPAGVSVTVQRVRVIGLNVTGTPVALPPMDVTALLAADGIVKQAAFTLPEGKAQLTLAQEEKGWSVDFESRGVTWPLGPKTAWESLRAKGIAKEDGIRFESIALTHFGGTATGSGDVFWTGGWKFGGTIDIGGMETGSITQAYYNATPVSGTVDGNKMKVTMSAQSLAQLIESTQIEGSVVVNKPAVNNIDLARSGQAGAITPGNTRFSDFAADLNTSGAKVQIKNIRANSGLLSVTGEVGVSADKNLSGILNIELGIASNRSKSAMKVGGTPADPKLSK